MIDYMLLNLKSIFCGELSQYKSMIFQSHFLTKFAGEDEALKFEEEEVFC